MVLQSNYKIFARFDKVLKDITMYLQGIIFCNFGGKCDPAILRPKT